MAFMLGAFTNGLASGAKSAMGLYSEYSELKSKMDTSDKLQKAIDERNSGSSQTGETGVQTGSGSTTPTAQSDSAASAPKSTQSTTDLSADPRATAALAAVGEHGNNRDTTAGPPPGTTPNAKSDSAMSAPSPGQQGQAIATGATGVQGNPAGDAWPSASTPTAQAGTAAPTKSQSPWMDWLTGRNPQNRAVHLTSTMGIAGGVGPSTTPMSTSPGGRPVGATVSDWGQTRPQTQPPPLSGAANSTPTLANQQTTLGQAIQTQYGGM